MDRDARNIQCKLLIPSFILQGFRLFRLAVDVDEDVWLVFLVDVALFELAY